MQVQLWSDHHKKSIWAVLVNTTSSPLHLVSCKVIRHLTGCFLRGVNLLWSNRHGHLLMDTIFPVRLLSQLRPLLIGFRKSKGLTQRELSAMLGITQQTYARLESNPSKASFERLYKVLNILGVEISLSSAPLSTYTNPANFVEKEFDSPARREEWW